MKKSILLFVIAFTMIYSSSAIQTWEYNYFPSSDNYTSRLWSSTTYSSYEEPAQTIKSNTDLAGIGIITIASLTPFSMFIPNFDIFDTQNVIEDSISSGMPLEFYYLYTINIEDWNSKAPEHRVNFCNFSIFYSQYGKSPTERQTLYSDVVTTSVYNGKYFVRLNKGDSAYSQVDCKFVANRTIEIPADVVIVTPSWECKECQFYDWYKDQIRVNKAKSIGTWTSSIWEYLYREFQMFYEWIVFAFWVLMILVLIFAIGLLIFSGVWIYKLLTRVGR